MQQSISDIAATPSSSTIAEESGGNSAKSYQLNAERDSNKGSSSPNTSQKTSSSFKSTLSVSIKSHHIENLPTREVVLLEEDRLKQDDKQLLQYPDHNTDETPGIARIIGYITNTQVCLYFTSVWCYFFGSIVLVPPIGNSVLGGILFTLGSFGFCLSDASELWKQRYILPHSSTHPQNTIIQEDQTSLRANSSERVSMKHSSGRSMSQSGRSHGHVSKQSIDKLEKQDITIISSPPPSKDKEEKNEVNILSQLSFFGSILFLVGSLLFTSASTAPTGVKIFIIGSSLFTCLSIIRIYQIGITASSSSLPSSSIQPFLLKNLYDDLVTVLVDVFAGCGAVTFATGSFLYLPELGLSAIFSWIAWALFQAGSTMYIISACFVVYKLITLLNSKHS